MSQDALAALERAEFPRRDFLKRSGALIVSFSVWGFGTELSTARAQVFQGVSPGAPPADQLDSWLAIAADGSVTAYTGKCELGQGMETAQTQLVAEELCVPIRTGQAYLLRYLMYAGSGLHVRKPVTPHEFQSDAIWRKPGPRLAKRSSGSHRNASVSPWTSLGRPMASSA